MSQASTVIKGRLAWTSIRERAIDVICGWEVSLHKIIYYCKRILHIRMIRCRLLVKCCPCWHRFSHIVEIFIMDAFVDLFITLCIVVNTAFMAADHNDMDPTFAFVLKQGNYVRPTLTRPRMHLHARHGRYACM